MILDRLQYEYWTLKKLGAAFAVARVRHRGRRTVELNIKDLGPMTVRIHSADLDTFRQVFVGGCYEPATEFHRNVLRKHASAIVERGKRPLILDLGANNGASAVWFAREFPEARIIAVEPDEENAGICRRNTAGRDVVVIEAAIGGTPGSVTLDTSGDTDSYSTQRAETGSVDVVTVDQIASEHNDGFELFIVKVDVEGFEADLFAANTEWLSDAGAVFIEPHDWMLPGAGSSRSFQRELGRCDFELLISGENLLYVRA